MSQHSPTTFTLLSVDRAMRKAPPFQMVGMARRRRPSLAPKAPSYLRDGASRLMFGTPAARRPYLFNDLV